MSLYTNIVVAIDPIIDSQDIIDKAKNLIRTNGIINIEMNGDFTVDAKIQISDITGKIVVEDKIGSSLNRLDISYLPKGIYMLALHNGGELIQKKFIQENSSREILQNTKAMFHR